MADPSIDPTSVSLAVLASLTASPEKRSANASASIEPDSSCSSKSQLDEKDSSLLDDLAPVPVVHEAASPESATSVSGGGKTLPTLVQSLDESLNGNSGIALCKPVEESNVQIVKSTDPGEHWSVGSKLH